MSLPPVSHVPDSAVGLSEDRAVIDAMLSEFLAEKNRGAASPHVSSFVGWLREFLVGGKRLRPLLCCCGWRATGGSGGPLPSEVTRVAASLELFHVFALIHDDVMDDSDTRRGRPTMHRLIAAHHARRPAAGRLGRNVAILLGDLALGWSYDLVHAAGLGPVQSAVAWPLLDAMRVDTMVGQYLDLLAGGEGDRGDVQEALRICRCKTGTYTIDYPLRLGAGLAGATPHQLRALTAYTLPLGEAFQLRDDLLGVFGNPDVTGKSCLDDLREGKHTALTALAYQRATPAQARLLCSRLGAADLNAEQAEEIRGLLAELGIPPTIERMITQRCEQAVTSLTTTLFSPPAVTMLRDIAVAATDRNR